MPRTNSVAPWVRLLPDAKLFFLATSRLSMFDLTIRKKSGRPCSILNPYAPEFAALIREGKAHRLQWQFMAPFVDFMLRHEILFARNTVDQMRWLGLRDGDLRITRPRGAYDPALL